MGIGSFLGVKRLGVALASTLSSAEVKESVQLYLYSCLCLHRRLLDDLTFTFTFTLEELIHNSFNVRTANYIDTAVTSAFTAPLSTILHWRFWHLTSEVVLRNPAFSVTIFFIGAVYIKVLYLANRISVSGLLTVKLYKRHCACYLRYRFS
jgi:hypothetical protein